MSVAMPAASAAVIESPEPALSTTSNDGAAAR
jgi:hypothetical protein